MRDPPKSCVRGCLKRGKRKNTPRVIAKNNSFRAELYWNELTFPRVNTTDFRTFSTGLSVSAKCLDKQNAICLIRFKCCMCLHVKSRRHCRLPSISSFRLPYHFKSIFALWYWPFSFVQGKKECWNTKHVLNNMSNWWSIQLGNIDKLKNTIFLLFVETEPFIHPTGFGQSELGHIWYLVLHNRDFFTQGRVLSMIDLWRK